MRAIKYGASFFRPNLQSLTDPSKAPSENIKPAAPSTNATPTYQVISESMQFQPVQIWGLVFVRCTYASEDRWKDFVSSIEQQTLANLESASQSPEQIEFLKQTLRMSTVEDKNRLESATLAQASMAFQEFVRNECPDVPRGLAIRVPRWSYYVYVNEESIESVLNPERAKELTGNFLIIVNPRLNLRAEQDDYGESTAPDHPEDDADESFKLVAADAWVWHYVFYAEDPNEWYPAGANWDGPPHVHNRDLYREWWIQILKADDRGAIGLDVYQMLKAMYGEGNYRSPCFVEDKAQSRSQRLRGYDGGFNFRIP